MASLIKSLSHTSEF